MGFYKDSILISKVTVIFAYIFVCCGNLSAQIRIDQVEAVGMESVLLTISSELENASELQFVVEVTSDIDAGPWNRAPSSTTLQSPGVFLSAVHSLSLEAPLFFRVKYGDQVSAPAQASFSTTDVTVVEGDGIITLEVILSRSITGNIFFTASGSGLSQPISGSSPVNGSTARIVLDLEDNETADPQRDITVSILADQLGNYSPGIGDGSMTVVILDNDSVWSGVIESSLPDIPIMILSSVSGAVHEVSLLARAGEFIPEGLHNALSTSLPSQPFSVIFDKIKVPASSDNGLFQDVEISIDLSAANSMGLDPLLQGTCRIEILYPGKPWLNTATSGTLTLSRVVEAPAARRSLLVPAP